jgi:hypothetical protein
MNLFKYLELKVPIELLQHVNDNRLFVVLGLFLLLKVSGNGHITLPNELKQGIISALQISLNTFKKHLKTLIGLNWVGVDAGTGIYYIRSFNYIRKKNGYTGSHSVRFNLSTDACTIKEFVQGALICHDVRRKIHGRNAEIIKSLGRSALHKESAIQELVRAGKITPYCGLSNSVIGKILGVSKSQADRRKKRLKELGYIRTCAQYTHVATFDKPDWVLYNHLQVNRRLQFHTRSGGQRKKYMLFERSYDEIIPCMEFVNQKWAVRKIKKDRVGVVEGV